MITSRYGGAKLLKSVCPVNRLGSHVRVMSFLNFFKVEVLKLRLMGGFER